MTSTLTTDIRDHIDVRVEYECDPAGVTVVSAVVEDWCRVCVTFGQHDGCPICGGSKTKHANILPTLTPAALSKLKEECADHAADRVAEHGLED